MRAFHIVLGFFMVIGSVVTVIHSWQKMGFGDAFTVTVMAIYVLVSFLEDAHRHNWYRRERHSAL